MRPQDGTAEWEIARLATAQHGVVTRAQLFDAGLTLAEVKVRLRRGALLREQRGVYRVGHRAPTSRRVTWPRCSPVAMAPS